MESSVLLLPPFWLGMVVAVSFLEAPLKFRAPGVTLALGLGIGRLVFRALNLVELVLAALLLCGLAASGPNVERWAWASLVVGALLAQLLAVRPFLARRTRQVLARPEEAAASRSRAHYAYVGLELVKVAGLIALCVLAALGRSA
ncbi:hypothetical protein [Segniliparus rugosus]|uniref:hypothetical protein n=1 Tax=Segniliparus rugosus TaxID=286804 RepID=UPI0001F03836|nr:hypothetical protein [Segniliparus rugosus]